MSQITIYIDNDLEKKVKKMATQTGLSLSKFIANVLEKNMTDTWDANIKSLSGSWDDFPDINDIRQSDSQDDAMREAF